MDIGATPRAAEIACCFFKLMLLWWWLLVLLLLQELLDDLSSRLLLWHGLVWLRWLREVFLNGELRTVFIEALFDDL